MKRILTAVFSSALLAAAGATLTIPWHTLDGGGGASFGTAADGTMLTLRGTVGQFDAAAPATGFPWAAVGGFWAGVAPVPGAPPLSIHPQPDGSALLLWTHSAAGWRLQSSTDLVNWTSPGTLLSGPGSLTVHPQTDGPRRFYRLAFREPPESPVP